MKISQHINKVKASWAYRHVPFLIISSLLAVILWQNFSTFLPSIPNEVIAYQAKEKPTTNADILEAEINQRTVEIYLENYVSNMKEARTMALIEQQTKLRVLAGLVPEEDYAEFKQVLNAMGNN